MCCRWFVRKRRNFILYILYTIKLNYRGINFVFRIPHAQHSPRVTTLSVFHNKALNKVVRTATALYYLLLYRFAAMMPYFSLYRVRQRLSFLARGPGADTKFPKSFSEYSAPIPVPIQASSLGRRGCLWCLGRLSLRTPTLPSSSSSPPLPPR